MLSTEKVRHAAGELLEQLPVLQAQASGMQAIAVAAAVNFAPGLVAQALEQLPDDPATLDQLLDRAAEFVTALKSDPAIDGELAP